MIYHKLPHTTVQTIRDRFFLSADACKVALDSFLYHLWDRAEGRSEAELAAEFSMEGASPESIWAGLACLAEAGLLTRDEAPRPAAAPARRTGALVSVILVSYNSSEWLADCLESISNQTYSPIDVVLVDNGSKDNTVGWTRTNHPEVKLILLARTQSLAYAINQGVQAASGQYYLVLNPDVKLDNDAVAQMVAVAQEDPRCAAVGAKLKFMWAPAFLNGLGNRVGPSSWGMDNAIGHLDLGQFDGWSEVPSACFAATLIPAPAWKAVGPVDEGFPMYYEDVEWCYRARVLGPPGSDLPCFQRACSHWQGRAAFTQEAPQRGLWQAALYI